MKNPTLRIGLLLAIAFLTLSFFGCPREHARDGDEVSHGLLILPKGDHPKIESHWKEIVAILHKASAVDGVDRKKLFRIRKYAFGQPPVDDPNDRGLDDTLLVEEVKNADAKALREKFNGHAIQIGLGAKLDLQTIPPGDTSYEEGESSPSPDTGGAGRMPQAHFQANILESQAMVDEVNKVLSRDSKKQDTPHP